MRTKSHVDAILGSDTTLFFLSSTEITNHSQFSTCAPKIQLMMPPAVLRPERAASFMRYECYFGEQRSDMLIGTGKAPVNVKVNCSG